MDLPNFWDYAFAYCNKVNYLLVIYFNWVIKFIRTEIHGRDMYYDSIPIHAYENIGNTHEKAYQYAY
jgi:hypothetical protein